MSAIDDHAAAFAALHRPGAPLLLANAWDAASAAVIAAAGAAAVGTTSAGVAWSLGAADAGPLGAARAAEAVARIVAAVDVPVTADIEDGYGLAPVVVAATVSAVVAAGAVGINLEDRSGRGSELIAVDAQVARLTAARDVAPVWINARTDVYLAGVGPEDQRLGLTLERADAYAAAGADSLFVPGLVDLGALSELVTRSPLPINTMVWAGAPTVSELAGVGVARISLGSAVAQAAYAIAAQATTELLSSGTYDTTSAAMPYADLNALLAR